MLSSTALRLLLSGFVALVWPLLQCGRGVPTATITTASTLPLPALCCFPALVASLLLLAVAFLQVCLPVVCLARELAPVTRLALTLPARTRRLSSPPPPPPCCFSPPPALFLLFPGPGRPTGLPTSDSVAHGLASRAGFLHLGRQAPSPCPPQVQPPYLYHRYLPALPCRWPML